MKKNGKAKFEKQIDKIFSKRKPLNKAIILYNLKDVMEQLERTIKDLEKNKKYELKEYWIEMSHIYHHLNVAWNARYAPLKKYKKISDKDFNKWAKYPTELPLIQLD